VIQKALDFDFTDHLIYKAYFPLEYILGDFFEGAEEVGCLMSTIRG
jgi:hypothetical protein